MRLRAFLAGCWRSHDLIRERDDQLRMILRCVDCGHVEPVLQTAIVTGPKQQPDQVLGQPTGRGRRVRTAKVTAIQRQSER